MTMRLLMVVIVLEQKMVEIYTNGFIKPFKSPAGAPRQAGKGLIFPEDFLLADASMGFQLQQCRYTVCVKWLTWLQTTKRVEILNGGPRNDLWLGLGGQECPPYDEYLDYTDILASTISLLIWPSKSPADAPRLFICNDDSVWLCIWGLNDLTMKNGYPLPWIEALPSWSTCQFWQEKVHFLG